MLCGAHCRLRAHVLFAVDFICFFRPVTNLGKMLRAAAGIIPIAAAYVGTSTILTLAPFAFQAERQVMPRLPAVCSLT